MTVTTIDDIGIDKSNMTDEEYEIAFNEWFWKQVEIDRAYYKEHPDKPFYGKGSK